MITDFQSIREAQARIAPFIKRTPVLTNAALDALLGTRLFFKCENLQVSGAFKVRGAHNAIFSLSDEEASHGVATHSSGNHAAAVALAAQRRDIHARIVMPSNTAKIKCENVRRYGGEIIFCEPSLASREETAARVTAETGATFVHPYEDARVIAGQGTAALEFVEEVPELDFLLMPVSGGGLLGGSAIAAKGVKPGIQVIGCEPEQADDAARSFRAGKRLLDGRRDTIADGLRGSLGAPNWEIIEAQVDGIITATERGMVGAMRLLWDHLKVLVEPSSAVPLAALMEMVAMLEAAESGFHGVAEDRFSFGGAAVGIILTGGNVDLDDLPEGFFGWVRGWSGRPQIRCRIAMGNMAR